MIKLIIWTYFFIPKPNACQWLATKPYIHTMSTPTRKTTAVLKAASGCFNIFETSQTVKGMWFTP